MSNDKKTLADAQPGGRVRLGDALPPLPEPRVIGAGRHAPVKLHYGYSAEQMQDYARAALSAQPSPGGQGGLNYERMFVDACAALAEVSRELGCDPEQGGAEPILAAIAELREALAARQPVGEQRAALWIQFAENGNIRFWTKDQDRALAESFLHARPLTAFYASPQPPAQAVDLPYSLDADPAGIRARVADVITGTLMVGAQGHTPPPAGHWAEPFWQAARADATAQAVDLGQFRKPVQDWLDDAQASIEEHGDYDGVFGHAIEEGTRLLALIDSQAVDK
ncbi:hypothetical protein RY963_002689 [Stenotrophomonas maltophilia]|nr:hypothetical protein [Stenotrophomonas maltophilia]ELN2593825.1 hypothetical protein [Stenotrophomonas maltophilia]MBH1400553.1 hypothetical protein [Stenotrophomonas maltophilia]